MTTTTQIPITESGIVRVEVTPSMWEGTAKFHERMARAFRSVGNLVDAASADEAARRCRSQLISAEAKEGA